MALDAEYFDSIYIDVVKKKYYNANKVQAVFADIRAQAEALNAENEELRRRLAEVNDRRVELGDALLSAQTIYQEIVERAKEKAAQITAAAEKDSAALRENARRENERALAERRRQEELAVHRVEAAFNRMKELHQANIDALNAEWQSFLCSLDPEQEVTTLTLEMEETRPEAELPADLEQKVGAIAEQIFTMDGEQ